MLAGGDQAEMNALAKIIQRSWIQFIKTGNPNHPAMPPWEAYDLENRTTMRLDKVVEPVGDLAGRRWRKPWPKRELAVS
jgi:para-nitrobenzyl esterase